MEAIVLNTKSLPLPIRERIRTKKVAVSKHGEGVVLLPLEDQKSIPKITRSELDSMLKGSMTESLLGAVQHKPISLDELREERLASKYCNDNTD